MGRFGIAEIQVSAAALFDVKRDILREQRHIAGAAFRSTIDGEAVWPFERAISEGRIDLEREMRGHGIAGDELCDGTIEILAGGIGEFAAVELDGAEVSELLGDSEVESIRPRSEYGRVRIDRRIWIEGRFHLRRVTPA